MLISIKRFLALVILCIAARVSATDIWDAQPFTADPEAIRQAAQAIQAQKHVDATVLLNDAEFRFDDAGEVIETRHLIYRVENQNGVENWAETNGKWEAWHQAKPVIKARVITLDGIVHWLDQSTLSDIPIHENVPDVYGDERKYGGPLPAVAPGAIIEEQVITRDTSPLFASGIVHRWIFAWNVPVAKTRFVLIHPSSLPLKYEVHLLPNAKISTLSVDGVETITLDQGLLPAFTEETDHAPPDAVLYPEIEFSTGNSWSRVAAEYAKLSDSKARVSDVQTLTARVNLKGARNEIIRRLVTVLHENVRYTGVEFGESSFIPQLPSETLKRRYGDCKDKAMFLVALLRAAGVQADLALLDAGPGRDINANMPGMGMFDHAIVYVPPFGSEPELWIDATARYSQVGTLPWMDYGRWALIVSNKTESLKQIPYLTAAENVHRETREFTLAEFGSANITEIDEDIGPADADNREYYSGDSKQVERDSEAYVKETYLADSLIALEHPDLTDLNTPALIKFVTKGKRGDTDLNSAVAAIRTEALFGHLPEYFRTKEDEKPSESEDSDRPKTREVDWWIRPFTTEWRYEVKAPVGFKLRALPPSKNQKIGTLTFIQNYSTNSDGTIVDAVLRVENNETRLTVQEAKDLRDAVVRAQGADPVFITFDHIGHSLMAAGKVKEGLAAYRQIVALHPREALHQVQLARALLDAGLGEQARGIAKQATILEPKSAFAFSTLGLVLKNDLIGRPLKKGMDYQGAISAYKTAIALDPKDKETIANLGLLLEYDPAGTRYSEHAQLEKAVSQFLQLRKIDEAYSRNYDDNILYDLWYAHDYQGVIDYSAGLQGSDVRKGLVLAAIAVLQGVDAAIKRSLEMTTDDQTRSKALVTAGAVLVRVRKYSQGAAMLAEGARGQSNEAQVMRSSEIFANAKPYEDLKIDSSDPRSVVHLVFGGLLSGNLTLTEFEKLLYQGPPEKQESLNEKQFNQIISEVRSRLSATPLPLVTIADLVLSNMHYTLDGDDAMGYKVIIEAPGAATQDAYVVKEGGRYKLAAFSSSVTEVPEDLGWLVLRELAQNNLVAARKWLDRARDKVHANSGDDPLSGAVFPYFWNKGQEAGVSDMRTAALVLLPSKDLKGSNLETLNHVRATTKSDMARARLGLVLAYAYSAQERWKEMLQVAQNLTDSFPSSLRAFDLEVTALSRLNRLSDWQRLLAERTAKYPDEIAYVRSSAQLAVSQKQFSKAREILKSIIDKGQANADDLNSYAWDELLSPSPVDQDAIDIALRANDLTSNNFAILHTLGCLYAQAGRVGQARESFLKAMDSLHLEEPNSELWFGFGLIAEQDGESDAAETMYQRVDKPAFENPGATYNLAQMHLSALREHSNTVANVTKH